MRRVSFWVMHVDAQGLLVADAGDGVTVTHQLRANDYGPQLADGSPLLGVNHVYGMYCPEGANPSQDGTVGCAARAAGSARYPAHAYLARNGNIWQVIPFHRCGIHCEHSWRDPDTDRTWEINRVSVGLEWAGCGWIRSNGQMPGRSDIDLARRDLVKRGHLYWQNTTPEQVHTASLFWRALVERYSTTLTPANALRGHGELARGGHELCPGPPILEALRNVVGPLLRGDEPDALPEEVTTPGGYPSLCQDPAWVFLEHGGQLTDEELRRYLSADEIERLAKCGALTHDDAVSMQSTLTWQWNAAALSENPT